MFFKTFIFKTTDQESIFVYNWLPEKREDYKGIVQIAHGMAEHAARYEYFARKLVEAGYIVYANDHRGHGKTAGSKERYGYFADNNGWELVVNDMYHLTSIIRREYPELPLFLFGHSMGSLLTRDYIISYGPVLEGVILSGTAGKPGISGTIGLLLAKWEIYRKGRKEKSPLLNKMTFASYNKQFEPVKTEFDWLSRDQDEVEKYVKAPYCGGVFTTGFFYDLLTGLKQINKLQRLLEIPKNLPIYLISGEKDPVGDNTQGVMQVYNQYIQTGLQDLQYKFYPAARHELLHEINRDEVIQDILAWLGQHN